MRNGLAGWEVILHLSGGMLGGAHAHTAHAMLVTWILLVWVQGLT